MLVSGLAGLACGIAIGVFFRVGALILIHLAALLLGAVLLVVGAIGAVTGVKLLLMASLCSQAGFLVGAIGSVVLRELDSARLDLSSR